MALTSSTIIATSFFVILFLAGCSAGTADSESSRSARWDAYRTNKRARRDTPTMEWQDTADFPTCTLSDITTFDRWGRRQSGVLATPQDQGMCGSCWAFAATHVFTDFLRLRGQSSLVPFSQDHLTKCISPFIDESQGIGNGCCGGCPYDAFLYFYSFGAVPETCLPYTLSTYSTSDLNKRSNPLQCPQSCVNSADIFAPSGNRILGFGPLTEANVITALDLNLPVFAAMEVRSDIFAYRCGVFCDDPIETPNHAVEIVDYSRDDPNYRGTPYWVVKNSWGDMWGEGGYFRIARGQNQLTVFVTITGTSQASPPAPTPSLTTSLCDVQEPNDESDIELIESAAEFAIEQLNNRSEICCAGNGGAVATLSLSRVINETIQVVEGFIVEVMVEVNVQGCIESTATITFDVMMDLEENFLLLEYRDYVVNTAASAEARGGHNSIIITTLAAYVAATFA